MNVAEENQEAGEILPALDDGRNSPACLIEFVVSPPALARPMIFALEGLP